MLLALDCANESRLGPDRRCSTKRAARRSTSTTTTTTRASATSTWSSRTPRRPGRSWRDLWRELGVELTPEIAEALYIALVTDTGRFQYANTTPKALRLAAELVEAGADVHRVFQGVYETVQFAKLKLLARALERAQVYEGGAARRLLPPAGRLRGGRRGRAVLGGDHRLPARGRGRRHGGADPRAAGTADVPRGGSACARAPTSSTSRRSRAPRAGGGHRQAAGFSSEATAIEEITEFIRREFARARRGAPIRRARRTDSRDPARSEPTGISCLVDKPAGPSSFAIVAAARPHRRAGPAGTRGRSTRSRPGCCSSCSGAATKARAQYFVGLDKRYVAEFDLTARTTTGDPEGDVVEEHEPLSCDELESSLEGLRGEVELPIPAASAVKIGGERAYKLHRRGRRRRDAAARDDRACDALDVVDARRGGSSRRSTSASSSGGTYVRAIADALGGHCVERCAGPRSGRSAVDEAGRRPDADPAPADEEKLARGAVKVVLPHEGRAAGGEPRRARSRSAPSTASTSATAAVIEAALAAGRTPTVVTFDPHPREALGYGVELLVTLERRLELLAEARRRRDARRRVHARRSPRLEPGGVRRARPRADRRRGRRRRRGTSASAAAARATSRCSPRSASTCVAVPLVEGVSSTAGSASSLARRRRRPGRELLGRPPEVEGTVVAGDARGGTLGFPTANLSVEPHVLVPAFGIYAGAALDGRAAISIGVNPHYGGERAADRGVPARLRGRPLRPAARRRALASACATSARSTARTS